MGGRHVNFLIAFFGMVSLVLLSFGSSCAGPNPIAPPAPLAEIPSLLVIPSDLTIDVSEAAGGGTSAFKFQTSENLRDGIESGINTITDDNTVLDGILSPFQDSSIPVDPKIDTFKEELNSFGTTAEFKFDFRPFDLDGDGIREACSGCTCPLGCAPNLNVCPAQASSDDLQPICFRIWINGERFMAGVFDRVPNVNNTESGRFRFVIPGATGLEFAITYDQGDPEDKLLDLSACFGTGGTSCSQRRRDVVTEEGPTSSSKKTIRLQFEIQDPPGNIQYQAQFFSNLRFIALELFSTGSLTVPDIENLTPPVCAHTLTGLQLDDLICSDVGLALTTGNFPTLLERQDTQLPSISEFPTMPTF